MNISLFFEDYTKRRNCQRQRINSNGVFFRAMITSITDEVTELFLFSTVRFFHQPVVVYEAI